MRLDVTVITSALTEPRLKHCRALLETLARDNVVTSRFVTEHDSVDAAFVSDRVKLESIADPALQHFNKHLRNLHVRNLSNARKHLSALETVASSPDDDAVFLVLEDDAIPCANWLADLPAVCSSLPAGYGIVSLGIPGQEGEPFRPLEKDALPVCDSYVVSKKTAAAMSAAFFPVRYATNVQLSYLAQSLGHPVHVSQRAIFLDGTKFGGFISVLTPNNRLALNGVFMDTWRAVTLTSNRTELRAAIAVIQASPYAEHPDFIYLTAMATMKRDGREAAEPLFRKALEVYEANAALLTSESSFLRDYINIYRDAAADGSEKTVPV